MCAVILHIDSVVVHTLHSWVQTRATNYDVSHLGGDDQRAEVNIHGVSHEVKTHETAPEKFKEVF